MNVLAMISKCYTVAMRHWIQFYLVLSVLRGKLKGNDGSSGVEEVLKKKPHMSSMLEFSQPK